MKPHVDRKCLLALAGAAVLLIGCTQDEVGKAPGNLEPSASSQRDERSNDASGGGTGSQSDDTEGSNGTSGGGSSGGSSGGSGSGSGGGSGGTN